jgi:hypothetical protein
MDEEERIQEGTEFRRTQVSLEPGTVMINPKLSPFFGGLSPPTIAR